MGCPLCSPRYQRSSYVTSKFIQDDKSVDIFSGQVQFYFEHTVPLPTNAKTHRLAFIKWYIRFLPCKFTIGNRKLITYMAVIPINRQFHL
ncbi:hypothetical protein GLOIN_2v1484835 [Rhizophagus irregularis DAOM 181602=DAOM 197198]|nr:hypothetical protein GLOIN_2v1484835 [Rhizophagus irregularis DAOM 181602=DAOM 197198]